MSTTTKKLTARELRSKFFGRTSVKLKSIDLNYYLELMPLSMKTRHYIGRWNELSKELLRLLTMDYEIAASKVKECAEKANLRYKIKKMQEKLNTL